jgi:hypothetical protein
VVEIITAVIEAKFGFLSMKNKGASRYAVELGQASFGSRARMRSFAKAAVL